MTEAMPFLQKYDITFLRPPTIRRRGPFLGCEWTQRPSPHGTHPKRFPQTGEASCVCTELAVRSI